MSGRRSFLASAAASVVAAGVASAVPMSVGRTSVNVRGADIHPEHGARPTDTVDANLLALCAAFHAKHAEVLEFERTVITDEEFDQLGDIMGERWAISDQIEDLTPRTAEGAQAMTDIALVLLVENHGDAPDSSDVRFTMAALRAAAGVKT